MFNLPQRSDFARADLTYTLPTGEVEPVLAFRYENVTKPLSFSKKEFVNSVAFGKLGQSNRRKQIGQSRDKCTLVFLKRLGEDLQQKVKTGTVDREIFAALNFHVLNFSALNFRHLAKFCIVNIARNNFLRV